MTNEADIINLIKQQADLRGISYDGDFGVMHIEGLYLDLWISTYSFSLGLYATYTTNTGEVDFFMKDA